jgi:hypothetical protein
MLRHRLATITLIALTSALAAFAQRAPAPREALPRTADGKPNLEGIWQASGTAAADLQDHAARYNILAGRSVVVGADIPYQPWAAAKKAENFQNRQKADPLNQCYIPGVPRIMYLDFPFQIFQTPQAVAMTFEWSLDYRLIHTDGSPHPADIDFWMGDSRGRWEGDTLVVDVNNFTNYNPFRGSGDKLHVVERYTRVDPNTILYKFTVEDRETWDQPWTAELVMTTGQGPIYEFGCHEGNYGLANTLRGARVAEKEAAGKK